MFFFGILWYNEPNSPRLMNLKLKMSFERLIKILFLGKISNLIKFLQLYTSESKELIATGSLLSQSQYNIIEKSDRLEDYEFSIFSQWGDDGVIQYLLKKIEFEHQNCLEFGVEDYKESNTRFLARNNSWRAYVIDGSHENISRLKNCRWFWKYDITAVNQFITKQNINSLIRSFNCSKFGIISVDIDGNDYHILQELDLNRYNPEVIICEYNALFGPERTISIPYDSKFVRSPKIGNNIYYGCSLNALKKLLNKRNYSLIYCTNAGNNAYFLRNDLCQNIKINDLNSNIKLFKSNYFFETRNRSGKLVKIDKNSLFSELNKLPFYDTESQKIIYGAFR